MEMLMTGKHFSARELAELGLINIIAGGKPVVTVEFMSMAMPAMKVEDFHFTSLSN